MTANLVLASASPTRREMLAAANVIFETSAPDVDEETIKDAALAKGVSLGDIAAILAERKAQDVALRHPGALVLGADQVLVCEARLFSKAHNLEQARETLKVFRGRQHQLISAAVLVRNGIVEWRHVETADLWVRNFSNSFLEAYLAEEGETLLGSVGCYRIEGKGVQIFDRVDGDQFTIRGLPLVALLGALRERGVLAS